VRREAEIQQKKVNEMQLVVWAGVKGAWQADRRLIRQLSYAAAVECHCNNNSNNNNNNNNSNKNSYNNYIMMGNSSLNDVTLIEIKAKSSYRITYKQREQ